MFFVCLCVFIEQGEEEKAAEAMVPATTWHSGALFRVCIFLHLIVCVFQAALTDPYDTMPSKDQASKDDEVRFVKHLVFVCCSRG